ncbi:MAG: hypothetical protein JW940_05455 [Polyangiaceae bacterium]|nr:hypothetical protein [Polyangiaceae bacterium]
MLPDASPPQRPLRFALGSVLVALPLLGFPLGCAHTSPASADTRAPEGDAVALRCERDGGFSAPSDQGALTDVPRPGARATVLEFWSPSCIPCESTVPAAVAERAGLADRGIDLFLVGVFEEGQKPGESGGAKLAAWGVAGESFLIDLGGVLMRRYGIAGPPGSVVLDAQGNLRWTAEGKAAAGHFPDAARRTLDEPCSP